MPVCYLLSAEHPRWLFLGKTVCPKVCGYSWPNEPCSACCLYTDGPLCGDSLQPHAGAPEEVRQVRGADPEGERDVGHPAPHPDGHRPDGAADGAAQQPPARGGAPGALLHETRPGAEVVALRQLPLLAFQLHAGQGRAPSRLHWQGCGVGSIQPVPDSLPEGEQGQPPEPHSQESRSSLKEMIDCSLISLLLPPVSFATTPPVQTHLFHCCDWLGFTEEEFPFI